MSFAQRFLNCCQIHWNGFFYFFSPLQLLPLIFFKPEVEWRSIFVILWAFIWYLVEAVPVGITGLLPIIFFPILGVMASQDVCMSYARDSQMLFLLSTFIAATMEHSNLSKRYAFHILTLLSCDPRRILFILMISAYIFTAFLPAAIVCALMMPTTRAILQILDSISVCKEIDEAMQPKDDETPYPSKVSNAFYIGVAYAINIGSITTAIASDSGLALREQIKNEASLSSLENNFHLKYLLSSLPVSLMLLVFTIYYLEIIFLGYKRSVSPAAQQIVHDTEASKAALEAIKTDLPPYNAHMILTSILYFGSWIGITVGSLLSQEINDKLLKYSFNAMLLCFLYFVLPSNCDFCNYFRCSKPSEYKPAPSILTWNAVNKLTSWKYFFVHGSSLAFGLVMKNSSLHLFIGEGLLDINNLLAQQIGFIGLTILLTIMGANNFVADIMLNMGIKALGENSSALLLYPITWSCCMTFLLPVSSTANCFAGGWGNLRAKEMIMAGIGPTVFGFLMAVVMCSIMGFSNLFQ
ncbi:protein I'm not dead yet-like [Calliphora vicina]|uniref:protein I'm not dead yet-like n=1 Tax=Calliphora vicina TaxID=7373 RepID=UPI00325C26A3